jgi:Na+/H+-translocating membrane pyrophosphatase
VEPQTKKLAKAYLKHPSQFVVVVVIIIIIIIIMYLSWGWATC